jgi:hypothetical protein
LFIIQNHLHLDLKSEYLMEDENHSLWVTLKGRYEQHKAILLPEANHEWTRHRGYEMKDKTSCTRVHVETRY